MNYEILEKYIHKNDFKIGICKKEIINKLSKSQIQKIKSAINYGDYTDLIFFIDKQKFVCEISIMADIMEIDIIIKSFIDYKREYGI